jgi:hypothetical protein
MVPRSVAIITSGMAISPENSGIICVQIDHDLMSVVRVVQGQHP